LIIQCFLFAVGIVGNVHLDEFVLQAVHPSDPSIPLGQWLHEPIEDTTVVSCLAKRDTLTNKHGDIHALFARWLPLDNYGPVSFR
jgi:hypothetical protein